jgi:alpha-tubulin suppressor-like RCC1 family protein
LGAYTALRFFDTASIDQSTLNQKDANMTTALNSRTLKLWMLAAATAVTLVACGGGGGGGDVAGAPPDAPASPISVNPLQFNAIATSDGHSCAVTVDGGVACWGENRLGQLGNDSTVDSSVPVIVQGLTNATAVSVNTGISCALRATGLVFCWGGAVQNQIDPTISNTKIPVEIAGITNAVGVSVGGSHACALRGGESSSGLNVFCWGNNSNLNLGDTIFNIGVGGIEPKRVPLGGSADGVAISSSAHSCALDNLGVVRCWGNNQFSQLGVAASSGELPRVITGFSATVKTVSAGNRHSCAVLIDGKVACWGSNPDGQLGEGTQISSFLPVNVPGINDAVDVSASMSHTCALRANGAVMCWGSGSSGNLGGVGPAVSSLLPVAVQGLQDAVSISSGMFHTCALRANKAIVCWGQSNLLGSGSTSTASNPVPTQVSGGTIYGK